MTPSTTIGAASNAYVAGEESRPVMACWKTHATFSWPMFVVLICSSELKRCASYAP